MRRVVLVSALVIGTSISIGGCTKKSSVESTSGEAPASLSLEDKGKEVYLKTCIACHSPDPAKDGGIGPAVAGSSRELLEARILKATYPAGYTPKRETRAMPQMPHLKDDIEALTAYLNKK